MLETEAQTFKSNLIIKSNVKSNTKCNNEDQDFSKTKKSNEN